MDGRRREEKRSGFSIFIIVLRTDDATKQSGTLASLTCIVNEPRKSIHSLAGKRRGGRDR